MFFLNIILNYFKDSTYLYIFYILQCIIMWLWRKLKVKRVSFGDFGCDFGNVGKLMSRHCKWEEGVSDPHCQW
jgi:hypothetical protein